MSNQDLIRQPAELNRLDNNSLLNLLVGIADVLRYLENQVSKIANEKGKVEAKYQGEVTRTGLPTAFLVFIMYAIGIPIVVFLAFNYADRINPLLETNPLLGIMVLLFAIVGALLLIVLPPVIIKKKKHIKVMGTLRNDADSQLSIITQREAQILPEFNGRLRNLGVTIDVIPGDYRTSFILAVFCKYLHEGRANTWRECIELYRKELHEAKIERQNAEMISNLKAIKAYTGITAIFSGYIASRL